MNVKSRQSTKNNFKRLTNTKNYQKAYTVATITVILFVYIVKKKTNMLTLVYIISIVNVQTQATQFRRTSYGE